MSRSWSAELGNLIVCGRYGKTRPIRQLYCRTCKARFSGRKRTPLYHCVLPQLKVIARIEHLNERAGVRATARLPGVHRDTVVRYGRVAGEHARQLHDEPVAISPADQRGPTRSRDGRSSTRSRSMASRAIRPTPNGATGGAIPRSIPSTSWFYASCPGRGRRRENVGAVVAEARRRIKGRAAVLITSDDYSACTEAIGHVYESDLALAPSGRVSRRTTPLKATPPELRYATAENRRRLGGVVMIVVHLIFGTLASLVRALRRSRTSRHVNVSAWNGTTRLSGTRTPGRPARGTRSRRAGGLTNHESMICFTMHS